MNTSACLFCKTKNKRTKFKNKTIFNNKNFYLNKCKSCKISYITPTPNIDDLNKLYGFDNYYQKFYLKNQKIHKEYYNFFSFIRRYLSSNDRILDYGCGDGSLIYFFKERGFNIFGADFESEMIINLKNKNLNIYNYEQILEFKNSFDCVYLRDVFEHSNDPINLLNNIFNLLNKNGKLIIEGPIEKNISLTNISINLHLFIKYTIFNKISVQPPYHLIFYSNKQLINFILSLNQFKLLKCKIFETGWPLKGASIFKNLIAYASILLSKILFIFNFYGNRSIIIFEKNEKK